MLIPKLRNVIQLVNIIIAAKYGAVELYLAIFMGIFFKDNLIPTGPV